MSLNYISEYFFLKIAVNQAGADEKTPLEKEFDCDVKKYAEGGEALSNREGKQAGLLRAYGPFLMNYGRSAETMF